MGIIVNRTTFDQTASNSINVTIPSTSAANALTVIVHGDSGLNTTASATGATFAQKVNSYTSALNAHFAYNISAGITTVTISYSGFQQLWGEIIETSGQGTSSDPWDTYATADNGFEVSSLGSGSITTGAVGAGLSIASFIDRFSGSTASGLSAGTGWTQTGAISNHTYSESRVTAANTGYGGASSQATVGSGSGYNFYGLIFNLFDAAAASADIDSFAPSISIRERIEVIAT